MIHEKYKLSCGVELDVLQPLPNGIIAIRLSKPGTSTSDFVQHNDERIGLFLDPKDSAILYDIATKLHKPTPAWKKFLNYVFLGKES